MLFDTPDSCRYYLGGITSDIVALDAISKKNANPRPHKADEEKAAEIDHHKDDQLKKQQEGKGHWKRELGSNSESAVCVSPWVPPDTSG